MNIEISEKTYETSFMGELRTKTNLIYAPSQTDENHLGFDASLFLNNDDCYWDFYYLRHSRHHKLLGISADELSGIGKELNRRMPDFKLNLFLQFKKPKYLYKNNAKERKYWNQSYYRYPIEQHQQTLLNKINQISQGRAIALYAAPAYFDAEAHFKFLEANIIIQNSNITNATHLNGHSKCSYIKAGNISKGHSEPEDIESQTIDQILESTNDIQGRPFTQHIKDLAIQIEGLFDNDPQGRRLLLVARSAILSNYFTLNDDISDKSWVHASITVAAFSSAFNIRVCSIG